MLSNACRPLRLSVINGSIAPSVTSCITIQTRLNNTDQTNTDQTNADQTNTSQKRLKGFKRPGGGKREQKPVRDKVSPPFLPLTGTQIASFGGHIETGLEKLPTIHKGEYPSKYYAKPIRFREADASVMKTFGLPRNIFLDFRLLSTPCSVSRKMTETITERISAAAEGSSPNNRIVLTGPSGCGKSYLLLQTVSYALANEWLVLYVPRAHKFIDSSTAYFYDPRTQTYLQPTASNQILQRFFSVNRKLVEQLKITKEVTFEKHSSVGVGQPLKNLFPIAAAEQHLAPTILSAVVEEVGKQDKFPLLFAVDEFHAMYCKTEYRNQAYEHIKSYHLSLPRLLMEYASGKRTIKRGIFLGAISSSLTQYPVTPEVEYGLAPEKTLHPYQKLRKGMLEYLKDIETLPVPEKLEYDEAAAMFEIWKQDRALHTEAYDELFLTKLAESAGNARDFVHGGLLATQTA